MPLAVVLAGLVLTAVGCGGCSPGYVLRAAYEETRILWSREPIDEVLESGALPEAEREKLELVEQARRFAAEQLGMDVGGAYGSVAEVRPGALLWVVSASDRFRLRPYTWWFPIVGDVAYKGFFHREDAENEAARLREEGYDTYVRNSAAFSTLGWFDDPVLSTWLEADAVPLVRLVLHELLHRTTYLEGRTTFNESFASFVGYVGAADFFAAAEGADAPRAVAARAEWEERVEESSRWDAAMDRLKALYRAKRDGELSEDQVLERRREIFAEFGPPDEINNAVILAHYAYLAHLAGFDCVLEAEDGDLETALRRVREESEEEPEHPFAALGPCAPDPDAQQDS